LSDDDLQASRTEQPTAANLRIVTNAKKLQDDDRTALATDLQSIWVAAESARRPMNENLEAYSALYEMAVEEQDEPWENAANLVLPIIPSELDAMKDNIAQQVFVQRLVIVTAADNDPETQRLAPRVEKFYNAELRRIRSDGKTPLDHFKTILHLGLRDGGAPCDVLFTERKEPKLVVTQGPKIVDDNVIIGEDGNPETEDSTSRIEETIAEVVVTPHLLKDWYLVPDESTSLHTALAQPTVVWMTEADMQERVTHGTFDADAVERVLQMVMNGETDVARQEWEYDKTAGGQIQVGQGQGSITSKFFANRGPARLIRFFSEQFDMNLDGRAEKNIFWLYPDLPELVGWAPYEYVTSQWPTFIFSPMPRPNRPYGYAVTERLADLTADACAGRNQRRNYIDLALQPLVLEREGDAIRDKDRAVFPGAKWTVEDVERSIRWWTLPQLPPDSFQDSAELERWISKVTGQSAPTLGAQSSARRSATEARQQAAATQIRTSGIAMEFRSFLRGVIQFWHKLNQNYLVENEGASMSTQVPPDLAQAYAGAPGGQPPPQPGAPPAPGTPPQPGAEGQPAPSQPKEDTGGTLTLTADVLARKFNIEIAGLSDPIDSNTQRQELMAAIEVAMKAFPWVFQDQELAYEWAESFVDTFNWAGTERLLGTREQATARKQQAEQQAQAAAAEQKGAAAMQIAAAHGATGGNGKPAGQPQPGSR